MIINYYRKQVYGKTLFYFLNSIDCLKWEKLTGKRTIDFNDMALIGGWLGIKFKEVLGAEK